MFFRMVYKSGQIFLPFCQGSRVWQTDGQTDGRTEFSSQYRLCITCSAVKTIKIAFAAWLGTSKIIECLRKWVARCGHQHKEIMLFANRPQCELRKYFKPVWGSELRYLGVFIVWSRIFKCSLVYAKRSFYRTLNSLFGKLLNLTSEVVI